MLERREGETLEAEAGIGERPFDRVWREVTEMARYVEVHPTPPGEPRLPASDVREPKDERASRPKPRRDVAQGFLRPFEVLEDVEHDDEVESSGWSDRGQVAHEHRRRGRRARDDSSAQLPFAADRFPAASPQRTEHPPGPTSDLHGDASRWETCEPAVDAAAVQPPENERPEGIEAAIPLRVVAAEVRRDGLGPGVAATAALPELEAVAAQIVAHITHHARRSDALADRADLGRRTHGGSYTRA